MKILMTGSHGFVGTNLIETLSDKHEIIRWDVRSDNELPDCYAVIHLAGKAHDTRTFLRPSGSKRAELERDRLRNQQIDEYYEVNTELTKKIFDAFMKSGAKKFIFFSSIKAKDNDTPYAKSKKLAEDYILNEISRRARDDKRVYILRPCMIHGKGVKGNLPLLFNYVKKGWPWPLAAFENQRNYASMGNVCYVLKELLNQDVESGIYNICDDELVSTNSLIHLMSECLGRKVKMLRVPKLLVSCGAKIGDILHLPLNTERVGKLTGDCMIDNSGIKHALGLSHMPIKAMDGLKCTIEEMIKKY